MLLSDVLLMHTQMHIQITAIHYKLIDWGKKIAFRAREFLLNKPLKISQVFRRCISYLYLMIMIRNISFNDYFYYSTFSTYPIKSYSCSKYYLEMKCKLFSFLTLTPTQGTRIQFKRLRFRPYYSNIHYPYYAGI